MSAYPFTVASLATVVAAAVLSAPAAAQACAKQGGKLTIATLSSPRQLDPHKTLNTDDYLHSFWMYNALTRVAANGEAVPDLAQSWRSNDELTKWTFNLRRSVLFHNGREMNAEDVVATIKRVQDPATASISRTAIGMVQSVTALNPYTVELTLSTPYAELPKAVAAFNVKIVPRDQIATLSEKPIGTGPFKFAELVPGSHIRVVRNDKYFMPGEPCLDEVTYKVLPEALVAATALRRGEIDIWYRVPADQVRDLQRAGGDVVVQGTPTGNHDVIVVHNKRKPFSDPKFRMALNYATDKQKVVDAVLFGYGTVVETPISPASPVFKKDLPSRKQDLAKAKQLLAEAGYPNGIDLTIIAQAGRPNRERLALVVQEMWKPIGVRLKIEKVPSDRFVADVEMKADMYVSGFAGRATVDQILMIGTHSKGSFNMYYWENAEVDRLIDDGRRARTPEEQARIYGRVQQIIFDDPPGVIPYVLNDYTAFRKQVQGYAIHPLWGVMYLDRVGVSGR